MCEPLSSAEADQPAWAVLLAAALLRECIALGIGHYSWLVLAWDLAARIGLHGVQDFSLAIPQRNEPRTQRLLPKPKSSETTAGQGRLENIYLQKNQSPDELMNELRV